jgi:flavodoxin
LFVAAKLTKKVLPLRRKNLFPNKIMKKLLLLLVAALFLVACNGQKGEKILVLYYSQSNTTKTVAQEIQKQLGCDIEEIVCTDYTGDFNAVLGKWQEDMKAGKSPEIQPLTKNVKDYDVIFLGYPIWGGIYASPVATFLKNTDFQGKKLVPFCTFGSGGLNTSADALKKNAKNANIVDGFGIRQARIAKVAGEVEQFLIKGGFKKGTLEQLPEFSAQKAVTDQEKEIFNQACSDYQFPLGTPSTVGSRKIQGGTEYLFTVEGQKGSSKIYVIAPDGAKPEFTQVVR